jgi:hypothetical protein
MPKHPLLPENYTDATMHAAILRALKPYELETPEKVVNPLLKWDLNTAWMEAQDLLADADWHPHAALAADAKTGWEMAADTDDEIDEVNRVFAALVARQMLDPGSGFAVRSVQYRKGGEMALIISPAMQKILQKLYPDARYGGSGGGGQSQGWLARIVNLFRKNRKG